MAKTGAKGGKGTLIQRSTVEGGPFTTIPEARDIQINPPEQEYADATHQESPGNYGEQIPIIKNFGTITFDVNFKPSDSIQSDLENDQIEQPLRYWCLVYPQFSKQYTFDGYVSSITHSAPLRDVLRASVTIQITGDMTKEDYTP